MKTKRRLLVIVVLVTMILIMSAGATFPRSPYALAETTAMEQSSSEVAMYEVNAEARSETYVFMNSNLDLFITEYNKTVSRTERMNASSIEYYSDIYLVDSDEPGVYFDLNGNNGYLIMSYDRIVYGLRTIGDYPQLKDMKNLYYSQYDEFLYIDENGIYQNCFSLTKEDNHQISLCSSIHANSTYTKAVISPAWQDQDKTILDIRAYVEDVYGNIPMPFVYESYVDDLYIIDQAYTLQYNTSYYCMIECDANGISMNNDFEIGEGNCGLNTMYSVLSNWAMWSLVLGIDYYNTLDISNDIINDPLYSVWGQDIIKENVLTDKSTHCYWYPSPTNLFSMPKLYMHIRNYAVNNYGYTPESGYYASDVPATLMGVVRDHYGNNTINVGITTTQSSVIAEIDSGSAVYMGVNNSPIYSHHAVSICGYCKYSRTIGIASMSFKEYYYFYQIADNWNAEARYFDPYASTEQTMTYCVLL